MAKYRSELQDVMGEACRERAGPVLQRAAAEATEIAHRLNQLVKEADYEAIEGILWSVAQEIRADLQRIRYKLQP